MTERRPATPNPRIRILANITLPDESETPSAEFIARAVAGVVPEIELPENIKWMPLALLCRDLDTLYRLTVGAASVDLLFRTGWGRTDDSVWTRKR